MKRQPLVQGLLRAVLTVSVAALFFAVAFPHVHNAASAHREESCRACKIQEGFSAAAPAASVVVVQPLPVVLLHIASIETPCFEHDNRLNAPRAPPQVS